MCEAPFRPLRARYERSARKIWRSRRLSDLLNATAPRSRAKVGVADGDGDGDCIERCDALLAPLHPVAIAAATLRQANDTKSRDTATSCCPQDRVGNLAGLGARGIHCAVRAAQ